MKFAAYADACLVIEMLAARLNWEKPLTWSILAIDLMPSVYSAGLEKEWRLARLVWWSPALLFTNGDLFSR